MKVCVLGSGSKGNCTLVQSEGTTLLIDAGFSGVEIKRRLQVIRHAPEAITAVIVTHEHHDHIAGVGVVSRQSRVPVYANPSTHRAAEKRLGKVFARHDFGTGEAFAIGGLQIHPFAVSHDTADPVGFIITDGLNRVGYCTDTGKVTTLIEHHLKGCDLLVLESNHDPQMLRLGPYPLHLQQRVRSNRGHLANEDAGLLLKKLVDGGLRRVVLAHLSETNNLPDLALGCVQKCLGDDVRRLDIIFASQGHPCQMIDLAEHPHHR